MFRRLATRLAKAPRRQKNRAAASQKRTGPAFQIEKLEGREMFSVSSVLAEGQNIVVRTDGYATTVQVKQLGSGIQVEDVATKKTWNASGNINAVVFHGSNQNDYFYNGANVSAIAYGYGGVDTLIGGNRNDTLVGGAQNDNIYGYGGNDLIFGEGGNDLLFGHGGVDLIYGGDNDDQLNGGYDGDRLYGQNGQDTIVALDGAFADYVDGGASQDFLWVDGNEAIVDSATTDWLQRVGFFANGADRTLDGEKINDPWALAGNTGWSTWNRSLFGADGVPHTGDVVQGQVGDCWLLAGLASIVRQNPNFVRGNVVDFNDGTFGVRLNNSFYRVDGDMPNNAAKASPLDGSMWVAVVEKAFAFYRSGQASYASLVGGWSSEVYTAFRASGLGWQNLSAYANLANASALANAFYQGFAMTVMVAHQSGSNHVFEVDNFIRNAAGQITDVILRNPWGIDGYSEFPWLRNAKNMGTGNDGAFSISLYDLTRSGGTVYWAKV